MYPNTKTGNGINISLCNAGIWQPYTSNPPKSHGFSQFVNFTNQIEKNQMEKSKF